MNLSRCLTNVLGTTGKGGKQRKRGKNLAIGEKRELLLKEEGTDYGQILRLLGGGRVEVNCFEGGVKRVCTIRGKLKNRIWMNVGDIVMVGLREFGDDRGDVIHKYYPEEAYELQDLEEIPANIAINEGLPDEEAGDEDLMVGDGEGSDGEENKNDDLDIDNL